MPKNSGRAQRDIGALILVERFGRPRAQETELSSRRDHTFDRRHSRPIAKDRLVLGEATAQGAWFCMDVIKNLNAIDEHVYEAMSTPHNSRLKFA